jgi:hypothetical protein
MKHTPGPYKRCPCGVCNLLYGRDGYTLIHEGAEQAESDKPASIEEESATTDRIKDCLIACDGMDDPAADIARLRADADRLAYELANTLATGEVISARAALAAHERGEG